MSSINNKIIDDEINAYKEKMENIKNKIYELEIKKVIDNFDPSKYLNELVTIYADSPTIENLILKKLREEHTIIKKNIDIDILCVKSGPDAYHLDIEYFYKYKDIENSGLWDSKVNGGFGKLKPDELKNFGKNNRSLYIVDLFGNSFSIYYYLKKIFGGTSHYDYISMWNGVTYFITQTCTISAYYIEKKEINGKSTNIDTSKLPLYVLTCITK